MALHSIKGATPRDADNGDHNNSGLTHHKGSDDEKKYRGQRAAEFYVTFLLALLLWHTTALFRATPHGGYPE